MQESNDPGRPSIPSDLETEFLTIFRKATDFYRQHWPTLRSFRDVGGPVKLMFSSMSSLRLDVGADLSTIFGVLDDLKVDTPGVTGLKAYARRKDANTQQHQTFWQEQFQGRGKTL
jgi:hypothetical protein